MPIVGRRQTVSGHSLGCLLGRETSAGRRIPVAQGSRRNHALHPAFTPTLPIGVLTVMASRPSRPPQHLPSTENVTRCHADRRAAAARLRLTCPQSVTAHRTLHPAFTAAYPVRVTATPPEANHRPPTERSSSEIDHAPSVTHRRCNRATRARR
jgi:hypothetical protein